MADFLKIIGIVVFVVAAAAGALTYSVGGMMTLVAILPALIGGAATYGLGEIMQNVREIRDHARRQADALERLDRRTDPQEDGFAGLKRIRKLGD